MSLEPNASSPERLIGAQVLASAAILGALASRGIDLGEWLAGPWGAPFVVVNLGLASALWLAGRLPVASAEIHAVARSGRRRDLELSRALVVDQLRQLEIERPKLSDGDYAQEREALLAVGARALEALERAPTGDAGEPDVSALVDRLRALRDEVGAPAWALALRQLDARVAPPVSGAGWVWAAAAAAILAALAFSASEQATERVAGAPMTGGDGMAGGPPVPDEAQINAETAAEKASLEAKLAEDPNNIETLNALTEVMIGERDLGEAMKFNQRALEVAAADPDARTYKAVLSAFVGMSDRALELLDGIVVDHPEHLKAWVYKGLVSMELNRNDDAIKALEKAIELGGPQPILLQALTRAKGAKDRPFPAEQLARPEGPPGDAPPAGAPPAPAADASAVIASGTIEYAGPPPAADRILWLSVRDPAGGPPLAAKRLPAGPFPLKFEITGADRVQMGGARPLPANVSVTARIGGSDPMARSPSDPSASTQTAAGATGLSLRIGG